MFKVNNKDTRTWRRSGIFILKAEAKKWFSYKKNVYV